MLASVGANAGSKRVGAHTCRPQSYVTLPRARERGKKQVRFWRSPGATDGAAFVVEMRRARLVSHLLVLQHVLVIAQPPGGGGGDINCVDGQQATGDASKIGKGTALLGAIACTDPAAVTVRSCPT